MDTAKEVAEFLTTRRSKVTPAQVGLPAGHGRRVKGLRRSEVATLAGVSVEYYTRIERGNIRGVSREILGAVADALLLDDAERAYLVDLADASESSRSMRRARRPRQSNPKPELQWMLDSITDAAAFVRNNRIDIVADNALGRELQREVYDFAERTGHAPNIARYMFLDPAAREFNRDWGQLALTTTAILRMEAGRRPDDPGMQELVGELSTKSQEFRELWAGHDVRIHTSGIKRFRHTEVGDLDLAYESLDLAGASGWSLTVYVAEPGSPSAERLRLLASIAASSAQEILR